MTKYPMVACNTCHAGSEALVAHPATVEAATIRDRSRHVQARVRSKKPRAILDKVERSSGVPIVIETI